MSTARRRWRRPCDVPAPRAKFRRHIGAIGVGQNEPRILWHDFDGHGLGDREKEPIAMGAIVPFCVRAKIRDGGFDFDDMDRRVGCQRDDVGASSRGHARAGRHGRDHRRGADGDDGPGRGAHDADDHGPDVDPRPRYHALRRGRFPRLDPPAPGPVR
jgi:hypothetical protein